MVFRLVFFLFFMTLASPLFAFAQEGNVEINFETLENYSPPPMFEQAVPDEVPARSEPVTKVSEPLARVVAPLPQHKPQHSGFIRQPNSQIDEGKLVIQTAQDILRAIDGDTSDVVPQPEANVVQTHSKPATTLKDLSSMSNDKAFEIVLPFEAYKTELSDVQKRIVLQQVLIRLQKYDDATLEIRSYASSANNVESGARRTALARALVIEALLMDKGIQETRIFLRPLGAVHGEQENAAVLSISRY
ncbi:MAG TPA: hypothetical protein PK513_10045 [Alphaproteobacteria bacterium]|nr:hypothetical protein [Alphaproteobacteria bacterium]USO06235.1 MAG: hypothetical protein H6859_03310 [Rhodospirillales bacterium]HOO82831.1 hypothetical protein [Alphaproteobacteria bacterium]